jgi:hypothetical protein
MIFLKFPSETVDKQDPIGSETVKTPFAYVEEMHCLSKSYIGTPQNPW